MKVIVDDREPKEIQQVVKRVCEKVSKKIDFAVERRDVGDIIIETDKSIMYIERKEFKDFINSSLNNRLYVQSSELADLQHTGARVMVLIHGLTEYYTPVKQLAWLNHEHRRLAYFYSAYNSIIYRYGIPCFFIPSNKKFSNNKIVEDYKHLKYALATFIKREKRYSNEKPPTLKFVKLPKHTYHDDVRLQMLQAIPYFSVKTCADLIEKFDNMKELVNAKEEEYLIPKKVGKKRAETLYYIFNAPFTTTIKRGTSK